MGSALKVIIDDTHLEALGLGYAPPTYSSTFGSPGGGGSEQASVTLAAPVGYRHPLLREGARFRVVLGESPVFCGSVDEIDRDTWVIHATGLAAKAQAALATKVVSGSYETSTVADTIIDQGIARGPLRYWRRVDSISALPYGENEVTEAPNKIGTILDGVAEKAGKFWTVHSDAVVRLQGLPTVVSYHMIPKALDMPVSYDEYAGAIFVRYIDSTSHTAKTIRTIDLPAFVTFPREEIVDATPLGEIPAAEATAIGNGILAQGKSLPGYTASIETTGWELLSRNFGPVDVRRVTAGQLIRLHGLTQSQNGHPWHDIVIGRVQVNGEASTVQINPMGLVTNGSQEDIISKVLAAAWDEKFKA